MMDNLEKTGERVLFCHSDKYCKDACIDPLWCIQRRLCKMDAVNANDDRYLAELRGEQNSGDAAPGSV